MGNHASFSHEQYNSEDKLLRRNMRIHSTFQVFQHNPLNNSSERRTSTCQESQRQSRSRSLEPKATQEIRVIEHSKSVRHSMARQGKNNKKPLPKLWDPEETRLSMLKQQLQNPTSSPPPTLMEQYQEFQKQLLVKRIRKSCHSIDVENFAESNQPLRSITGLSTHQTQILQKIWTRATENDVIDCSHNIFAHLLRSNVHMYKFFGLTGMSDKEIVTSTTFARQSANFAMVFDFVITNMADDVERLCFALQSLGERHTRLGYPIEEIHWAFSLGSLKTMLRFPKCRGHTVWKLMVAFIIIQMRIGYNKAAESLKSARASISHGSCPPPASSTSYQRSQSAQNRRLQQKSKKYASSDTNRSTTLT
uniref:Globin family profile domain-containing protein n=1 Tax=Ditylenchus dipsaci TaxID=166011 RepID=A0A915DSK7_9BILA